MRRLSYTSPMAPEASSASTMAWNAGVEVLAFADCAITAERIIRPAIAAADRAARGTARRGTEGVTSLPPLRLLNAQRVNPLGGPCCIRRRAGSHSESAYQ